MFLRDLLERALRTYVQALCGLVAAGAADMVNVSTLRAAAIAAIPAALSVVTSGVASRMGDPATASLIAPPTEACPGAAKGWD